VSISILALVEELQPYAQALIDVAGANRLNPRVTSTRRTLQEQRTLYRDFLAGKRSLPVAQPLHSAHVTGEAFDLVVTPWDYLADLGAVWTEWGGLWGGRRDPVHFQLPGAPSSERLAELKGPKSFWTWLTTPGGVPRWVEIPLSLLPGASLTSEALSLIGIK